MIDKGMSMTQLASQLGISRPYLTEIFSGTRKAKKQKQKIATILGMKIVTTKNTCY
ncbi:helix-turn-helix transcriptional regulator [Vallitalea pronyensis]|uniref:Helix-turn-helix transcriptional regulator n=2 Tax=Vallitalea pronyensis TaxID=1348613 RepID=A0A8J8SJU0_9FIRM|nr:helix-turn-helix transcriptional regulator [Vallitalea pronyensis]